VQDSLIEFVTGYVYTEVYITS